MTIDKCACLGTNAGGRHMSSRRLVLYAATYVARLYSFLRICSVSSSLLLYILVYIVYLILILLVRRAKGIRPQLPGAGSVYFSSPIRSYLSGIESLVLAFQLYTIPQKTYLGALQPPQHFRDEEQRP